MWIIIHILDNSTQTKEMRRIRIKPDNSTQTATVAEMRFCEKCNIWHTPGQHLLEKNR